MRANEGTRVEFVQQARCCHIRHPAAACEKQLYARLLKTRLLGVPSGRTYKLAAERLCQSFYPKVRNTTAALASGRRNAKRFFLREAGAYPSLATALPLVDYAGHRHLAENLG